MRLNSQQRPITNSTDEIFDVEWSKEKKKTVREEYRKFFQTLSRKDRNELGRLINDGREEN